VVSKEDECVACLKESFYIYPSRFNRVDAEIQISILPYSLEDLSAFYLSDMVMNGIFERIAILPVIGKSMPTKVILPRSESLLIA
jgi:hypothetical protein